MTPRAYRVHQSDQFVMENERMMVMVMRLLLLMMMMIVRMVTT